MDFYIFIMNDYNKSDIYFGANFIHNVHIQKLNKIGEYKPFQVSLVEIDITNEEDINALSTIHKKWKKTSLITFINYLAITMRGDKSWQKDKRIYALTTQKENFKSLIPNKILGVASLNINDTKKIHIEALQTKPRYIVDQSQGKQNPKIKGIGSAIISSLKNMFDEINLFSTDEALGFYAKNGFKEKDYNFHFTWNKSLPQNSSQ